MTPHQKRLAERYPERSFHFDKKSPTTFQKAASYLKDTMDHVRNGLKVTPPAVEKIRLETCQACPHYNPQKQSCKLCGCKSKGSTWLTNKLKRASSVCPDKPPRWLAYQPTTIDFWLHFFTFHPEPPEGLELPPEAQEARRRLGLEVSSGESDNLPSH